MSCGEPRSPQPKAAALRGQRTSITCVKPCSAHTAGPQLAIPKVVISRASRHEVVDTHGARLSNAVRPVLSLHQHLRGPGGQAGCRSSPKQLSPPQQQPFVPKPRHNPSSSEDFTAVPRGRGPMSLYPQTTCHLRKDRTKQNTGRGTRPAAGQWWMALLCQARCSCCKAGASSVPLAGHEEG